MNSSARFAGGPHLRCVLLAAACSPVSLLVFFFFFAGRRSAEPRRPPAHILRKATDWSLIFSFILSVPLDPPRSTHPRRCPRHSLHVGSLCRHSTPRGPSPSGHPLQPWGTWPAPDTQRTPRSPPSRIFPTPLPNLGIASPQPPRPPRRRDDMERQGRVWKAGNLCACPTEVVPSARRPLTPATASSAATATDRLAGGHGGCQKIPKGAMGGGWGAPLDPRRRLPGVERAARPKGVRPRQRDGEPRAPAPRRTMARAATAR